MAQQLWKEERKPAINLHPYCDLPGNQHGLARESVVAQGQPVNATASPESLSRGHLSQDGLVQQYFNCPHTDLSEIQGLFYPYPDPSRTLRLQV